MLRSFRSGVLDQHERIQKGLTGGLEVDAVLAEIGCRLDGIPGEADAVEHEATVHPGILGLCIYAVNTLAGASPQEMGPKKRRHLIPTGHLIPADTIFRPVIARKLRDKARKVAAHLLEASPDDLEWDEDRFRVKGVPDKEVTIQEAAFAAYTNHPEDEEAGLEGVHYYNPPNMTYPFGSYPSRHLCLGRCAPCPRISRSRCRLDR